MPPQQPISGGDTTGVGDLTRQIEERRRRRRLSAAGQDTAGAGDLTAQITERRRRRLGTTAPRTVPEFTPQQENVFRSVASQRPDTERPPVAGEDDPRWASRGRLAAAGARILGGGVGPFIQSVGEWVGSEERKLGRTDLVSTAVRGLVDPAARQRVATQ